MPDDISAHDITTPTTGRSLSLPSGLIFHLQRAGETSHELGAFRAWAGYREFGCHAATDGLALFQHVLSFGPSEVCGRTGIHAHLAQVHIVIPSSGRGVFSYDGVETEAVPGTVIVQHGGTVHDQFGYSYAADSEAENRLTPMTVDAPPPGAAPQSFSFLELFIPARHANVEIVAPEDVTPQDQATAWDHPYHPPGASFAVQGARDPGAAWRPVIGHPDLQLRDAETWEPTGKLVATQILRSAAEGRATGRPLALEIPGEVGGLEIYLVVAGSIALAGLDGAPVRLRTGDCLTCTVGVAGALTDPSIDLRLMRLFISARAETLRERTPEEIAALEAMGPAVVRRREVRPDGDVRPVNFLSSR